MSDLPARAASARSDVSPFYVMELYGQAEARRAEGLPVYNLAAGQPSTPAPKPVLDAAARALGADRLGYTDARGLPALRRAIAGHTRDWYGVEVDPANVLVTTGSSGGFLLSFLAAFSAGDVVALARPGYPAYRNILSALGCVVAEFDCGPEHGFIPTIEVLDALEPRPAGLIVASPANPTGSMLSSVQLAGITEWCVANGVRLISDELYHGITYNGSGTCAWQFDRSPFVVGSFSKYFSMTGWRLGWLLVPDDLVDALGRLASNFTICPPALSQYAALAAFDDYAELDANVVRYARNRELLLDRLPALGLGRIAPPDGAFYIYADVSAFTADSLAWTHRLLADTGVALAPGVDFDPVAGQHFARISFAGSTEELSAALDVLGAYLG